LLLLLLLLLLGPSGWAQQTNRQTRNCHWQLQVPLLQQSQQRQQQQ
jgi:hypothetical protein